MPFSEFAGRVIPHPETIEIGEVFLRWALTRLVLCTNHKWKVENVGKEGVMEREHVVITERNAGPLNGFEIIGATLLSSRSDIPIRWFDCVLSLEDARKVKWESNPVTLQVATGLFFHLMMGLTEGTKGIFSKYHNFGFSKGVFRRCLCLGFNLEFTAWNRESAEN